MGGNKTACRCACAGVFSGQFSGRSVACLLQTNACGACLWLAAGAGGRWGWWPLGLVAAGAGMSTVALIVAPGSVVGSQMPLEVMGLSEPF